MQHREPHRGLPERDAADEIRGSRRAIEGQLEVEIRHFAFPYGGPDAAGPRGSSLARAAGFRTALTTRPDHIRPGHSGCLNALPRVQISGLLQDDAAIKAVLSGVPFLRPPQGWRSTRRPA